MTFRLRAAHISDLEHLYEMAKLTGGGFTNLPADRCIHLLIDGVDLKAVRQVQVHDAQQPVL